MRKKHNDTLEAIFHTPVLSNVKWSDVEALFVNCCSSAVSAVHGRVSRAICQFAARHLPPLGSRRISPLFRGEFFNLGAKVLEGRGSRVRIFLNDQVAVFHRPHPRKETDKGALVSVRRFLEEAGVKP